MDICRVNLSFSAANRKIGQVCDLVVFECSVRDSFACRVCWLIDICRANSSLSSVNQAGVWLGSIRPKSSWRVRDSVTLFTDTVFVRRVRDSFTLIKDTGLKAIYMNNNVAEQMYRKIQTKKNSLPKNGNFALHEPLLCGKMCFTKKKKSNKKT